MSMHPEEMILRIEEFIRSCHKGELKGNTSEGRHPLEIDFQKLRHFNKRLAGELLDNPEYVLKAAEIALSRITTKSYFTPRLIRLPQDIEVRIHNLRSEHIGKLIVLKGIVSYQSEVLPVVVSARFECPACGAVTSKLQLDTVFRQPTRCTCGRKGGFKTVHRELVDTQRLLLKEASDNLREGEQPRQIIVHLKADLTSPSREYHTVPGKEVKVAGIVTGTPEGGRKKSTKFTLALEANNVYPVGDEKQ